MTEPTYDLTLVDYATSYDITASLFKQHVVQRERLYWRHASWPCTASTLQGTEMEVVHHFIYDSVEAAFVMVENCAAHLEIQDGEMRVQVSGDDMESVESVIDTLQGMFPLASPNPNERRVPMYLWVMTPNGARKMRRMIDVPSWQDVAGNYAEKPRVDMDSLAEGRPDSGKIILWHGPPGTGKSFALRALAWEWRDWCDLHYVVDPEVMFGEQASYLVNLLFDDASVADLKPSDGAEEEERWRLLVLEDTGEMLTMDAKEHVGQALSRLLNVTDGLIGQGLRLLILVTTNEEMGRLHPAVARPGRCAAEINFTALSRSESARWAIQHGVRPARTEGGHLVELGREYTLAELFALSEDRPVSVPQSAGFRLTGS